MMLFELFTWMRIMFLVWEIIATKIISCKKFLQTWQPKNTLQKWKSQILLIKFPYLLFRTFTKRLKKSYCSQINKTKGLSFSPLVSSNNECCNIRQGLRQVPINLANSCLDCVIHLAWSLDIANSSEIFLQGSS